MASPLIIALRRHYHCVRTREVLREHGLSYPVYEINPDNPDYEALSRIVRSEDAQILVTGEVYADSLMEQLNIPVVTIRRSRMPYELSLSEAFLTSNKTAILCRDQDEQAARKACLRHPSSKYYVYSSSKDGIRKIHLIHHDGFDTVVCAAAFNQEAEHLGLNIVNVPYDEVDILAAVRTAEHNAQTLMERNAQNELLGLIQDSIPEGILSLSSDGIILSVNRAATLYLGLDTRTLDGMNISETPLSQAETGYLLKNGYNFEGKAISLHGETYSLSGRVLENPHASIRAILTLTPLEALQNQEQQTRRQLIHNQGVARIRFSDIIGTSPVITDAIRTAQRYAAVDSPVLVYGPSGTGKEMFVQSIHNASRRRNGPFVVINCAALPESIIESELFGYEKGAFTGALSSGKQGLFVQGHNGTVFLDEVSEMPLHIQARFLRVLQEREVTPLGGGRVIPVDIRVIAATNRSLKEMVDAGEFREDLYYRINVLSLTLPPLDCREGDKELLIRHFIKEKAQQLELPVRDIEGDALVYLCSCPFPGNIRQLSNVLERAMVLSSGTRLTLASAKQAMRLADGHPYRKPVSNPGTPEEKEALHIREVLQNNHYRRADTARELGVSTSTLYRKMRVYGLI